MTHALQDEENEFIFISTHRKTFLSSLQGEVLTYVKKEICSKVGSLREMVKLFFVLSVQTSKEFRLVRTNNRC